MANLRDHGIRPRAAAAAAHVGNNAERAAIVASVLNLEIRPGAVTQGIFNRRGKKVALFEDVADADLAMIVLAIDDQIGNRILVRVPDHEAHAGQSGDFLGRTLGVAAGDHDTRLGLCTMNAPDGLAKFVVGGRRYGTGV
jgi:hypothetical protein